MILEEASGKIVSRVSKFVGEHPDQFSFKMVSGSLTLLATTVDSRCLLILSGTGMPQGSIFYFPELLTRTYYRVNFETWSRADFDRIPNYVIESEFIMVNGEPVRVNDFNSERLGVSPVVVLKNLENVTPRKPKDGLPSFKNVLSWQ